MFAQDISIITAEIAINNKYKSKSKNNWYSMYKKIIDDALYNKYLDKCTNVNNIVCPISMENIINPVSTKCGHIFEKEHMITWIKDKKSCPVCRANLYNL